MDKRSASALFAASFQDGTSMEQSVSAARRINATDRSIFETYFRASKRLETSVCSCESLYTLIKLVQTGLCVLVDDSQKQSRYVAATSKRWARRL
jgi:hypothetical protein